MNMKYAACFLLSGFTAIGITAGVIWAIYNYPDIVGMAALGIAVCAMIGCLWGLIYHYCSQAIKNKEVPVKDMIRGIHYDVDPRSESLRTSNDDS